MGSILLFGGLVSYSLACELAVELNRAFMSTERYDGQEKLEAYMARTGILATMCTGRNNSTCDEAMDHVSASWASNSLTGYRLYPGQVGWLLNPAALQVRCVYPTDASTDARDNAGCGPHSLDPVYGSKGYAQSSNARRLEVRLDIQAMYTKANVSWSEVPCSSILTGLETLSALGDVEDVGSLRSYFASWSAFYEPFLGHPVCSDDSDLCVGIGRCGELDFLGNSSWPPERFGDAIDTQRELHDWRPKLLEASWNEIVVRPTTGAYHRAAFWLNDTSMSLLQRRRARAKARALAANRSLPVLVANFPWAQEVGTGVWPAPWSSTGQPGVVFACDEERQDPGVSPLASSEG